MKPGGESSTVKSWSMKETNGLANVDGVKIMWQAIKCTHWQWADRVTTMSHPQLWKNLLLTKIQINRLNRKSCLKGHPEATTSGTLELPLDLVQKIGIYLLGHIAWDHHQCSLGEWVLPAPCMAARPNHGKKEKQNRSHLGTNDWHSGTCSVTVKAIKYKCTTTYCTLNDSKIWKDPDIHNLKTCLLYTSPSPRD